RRTGLAGCARGRRRRCDAGDVLRSPYCRPSFTGSYASRHMALLHSRVRSWAEQENLMRGRRRLFTGIVVLAAGGLAAGLPLLAGSATAAPLDRVSNKAHYELALFGDMPYGDVGRAQYPRVLSDINSSRVAFSLFDGDIKNGSEP